jgi:membrane protease YdiL (CAAX protease family)
MLLAVDLALLLFLIVLPLPHIGYTFRLDRNDWRRIRDGLTLYTFSAVPIGLLTGFLVFGFSGQSALEWVAGWPLMYLFTALPEEFLFRGVIQQRLHQEIRNERWALLIGSAIFGLAHLNNATAGFPEPNWMYAVMATLAGLAYGWTWRRTGKITAAAVVHATVNIVWIGLLQG